MWRKREAEWEREVKAREKLMAEVPATQCMLYLTKGAAYGWIIVLICTCLLQVMNERQRQIQKKMDALKARQVSQRFHLKCKFSRVHMYIIQS